MDASSVFYGHGIQHSGTGNLHIGGNVNIGTTPRSRLLADLYVTDPYSDRQRIQETKGGLLEGSYRWVLSHDDFLQWRRDDSPSRLLWIRGDPGKGKTMLMCGIIEELEKSESASNLAYFFCQATDERLSSASSVLRGLIYMLLCRHPELACHLEEDYGRMGKPLFEGPNAWVSMVRAFTTMLSQPVLRGQILIVDGLDECTTDMNKLVELISDVSYGKWAVSSRNWPVIADRLHDTSASLCLELNPESVATAVHLYIEHQVEQLTKMKRYNETTRHAVRQHLIDNADGTFLWVALVSQQLANPQVRKWHVLDMLKTFPPGLEGLYERMMSNVLDSLDADLCREILAIVSLVLRPVSTGEIMLALDSADTLNGDLEALEEIIAFCGSFLTLRDSTVFFVHQSAKDFILNQALTRVMPQGASHQHGLIFARSVRLLNTVLKRDIYQLREPGTLMSRSKHPKADPWASYTYFAVHFLEHFRRSDAPPDAILYDLCLQFLSKKLLFWLEALGLLESVPQGVLAIHNLFQHFLAHPARSRELMVLAADATRFVRSNAYIISKAPLQVYFSALMFAPKNSSVKKYYSSEMDSIELTVSPAVANTWSLCLTTMEGHTEAVTCVKYAADGRVASLCSAGDMKIWDPATGLCLQTCNISPEDKRHGPYVFAFGPSAQLAVGSWTGLVKVYSPTLDEVLLTMNAHAAGLSSIAMGDDGTIACGHDDGTVVIVKDGHSRILEGHDDRVSWLEFSENKVLMSAAEDGSLKTWDYAASICKHSFEPENAMGPTMVTPDGRIVIGEVDGKIIIRDPLTGGTVFCLEGHTDSICSLALSSDGKLASCSSDRTVRIWHLATGNCTHLLLGHMRTVTSISFAPDGDQLASGSEDLNIKIWDLSSFNGVSDPYFPVSSPGAHEGFVGNINFSPSGDIVVSESQAGTLKVWNALTGECLETQARDDMSVRAAGAAFAPDGKLFASGSRDHNGDDVVEIYDFSRNIRGRMLLRLHGAGSPCWSMRFSPDGKWLATGYYNGIIKIWDTATAICLVTLEGHVERVCSIDFSPCGARLASGSFDMTAKVWDLESGACLATFSGSSLVNQVCFVSKRYHLSVGWESGILDIFDPSTGACAMTATYPAAIELLSFNVLTSQLQTNLGFLEIDIAAMKQTESRGSGPPPRLTGLGISKDRDWILRNGRRILWLPPEYRPDTYYELQIDIHGGKLAVGCRSGRVSIYCDTSVSDRPAKSQGRDPGSTSMEAEAKQTGQPDEPSRKRGSRMRQLTHLFRSKDKAQK